MNEKELAQAIETAVNNYSFDPKKVAAQVPMMHRTLQQSVYKLSVYARLLSRAYTSSSMKLRGDSRKCSR